MQALPFCHLSLPESERIEVGKVPPREGRPACGLRRGDAPPQLLRLPPVSYDGHISSLVTVFATLVSFFVVATSEGRESNKEEEEEQRLSIHQLQECGLRN